MIAVAAVCEWSSIDDGALGPMRVFRLLYKGHTRLVDKMKYLLDFGLARRRTGDASRATAACYV